MNAETTKSKSVQAFFLDGTYGKLFSIFTLPDNFSSQRAVLFFPPFAEEMNKTRRSATLLAQQLVKRGCAFLQIDLYGSGDSEGDFSDARWETWRKDMLLALDWLRAQGIREVIWCGVRLGALLALDTLQYSHDKPAKLVFWQPVTRGENTMTQFLRLRLAADLISQGEKITVKDLRETLKKGQSIEVAGYMLAPELVQAIDGLSAENFKIDNIPVHWIELVASAERPVGPANQKVIQHWKDKGLHVKPHPIVGQSFWMTPEIVVVPELFELSAKICCGELA